MEKEQEVEGREEWRKRKRRKRWRMRRSGGVNDEWMRRRMKRR